MLSAKASTLANIQQERASKLALSGVIEERKVGQRTTLDVLNAQSEVLTANELLVNSRRNELVAGYAVMSAIGRLNSRRFSLKVAHYEPKEHYRAVKDKWYGWRTPDGR
jgi:outer membrane protein